MIYDVLLTFGEPSEESQKNSKYAKWKAAYIHNCLKNGETPMPGIIIHKVVSDVLISQCNILGPMNEGGDEGEDDELISPAQPQLPEPSSSQPEPSQSNIGFSLPPSKNIRIVFASITES